MVTAFADASGAGAGSPVVGSAPPVSAELSLAALAVAGTGAPRLDATGVEVVGEATEPAERASVEGPVESDVVGVDAVDEVVAGPSGSTMDGVAVVVRVCAAVDDVTGDVAVDGMLVDGVGTVGRTIVGVLVVAEGRLEEDGGVIVVDGNADEEVVPVVIVELVAEGMLIDGAACWARAGVEPSARTAAMAAVAQSGRVGTMCVMNTTMRPKSKSYSLTCLNPGKTTQIKRRTDLCYAR